MSEQDTGADDESALRSDYKPQAPKRRGRKPKEAALRHDSEGLAPINGFGNPFDIKLKPGWVAFWVNDRDRMRMGKRRWSMATYGDPRVVSYDVDLPGEKGQPIVHNELTCYLMSEDEAIRLRTTDPQRAVHKQRVEALKGVAEGAWVDGKQRAAPPGVPGGYARLTS